jgi:hypothetical protein
MLKNPKSQIPSSKSQAKIQIPILNPSATTLADWLFPLRFVFWDLGFIERGAQRNRRRFANRGLVIGLCLGFGFWKLGFIERGSAAFDRRSNADSEPCGILCKVCRSISGSDSNRLMMVSSLAASLIKSQVPNPKELLKSQFRVLPLRFGYWSLPGIWVLGFGTYRTRLSRVRSALPPCSPTRSRTRRSSGRSRARGDK